MAADPVTRPEFDNALEGIRRELQAMGEHIGSDLAQIRAQLTSLLEVRNQEGREVGELAVRVARVEKDLAEDKTNRWMLYVALVASLAGHIITWFFKGARS